MGDRVSVARAFVADELLKATREGGTHSGEARAARSGLGGRAKQHRPHGSDGLAGRTVGALLRHPRGHQETGHREATLCDGVTPQRDDGVQPWGARRRCWDGATDPAEGAGCTLAPARRSQLDMDPGDRA